MTPEMIGFDFTTWGIGLSHMKIYRTLSVYLNFYAVLLQFLLIGFHFSKLNSFFN
jgi:hypothetical protein